MGSVRLKGDAEKLLLVASVLVVDNIITNTAVRSCFPLLEFVECMMSRTLNVDVKLVVVSDLEGSNFAC